MPQQDHASSLFGDAEVVRLTSPADFAYAFEGRARELLAKAESAARAMGVPCESRRAVSDTPDLAIIAAARAAGCDLIFMASHGRRGPLGMMLASQTLKVLVHAGIPVLVSATGDPAAPARAIGIIHDEHRSLAAVMHAWMHLLASARRAGTAPDPALMRAVLRYLQAVPGRASSSEGGRLSLSQAAGADREPMRSSTSSSASTRATASSSLSSSASEALSAEECRAGDLALERAVTRYATFMWDHLGREEGVILPAAERYLLAEDWAEIDAAFSANRDPRFAGDTDAEFRRLFSRIVNLAPA